MEHIEPVNTAEQWRTGRRLFGASRRAVEDFASAAEVCA
jgi:hypothetical protein